MMRYGVWGCVICGCVVLAGETGWQGKEFKDWTEKDARAIVTDSPWAKSLPLPNRLRSGVTTLESPANGEPASSAALGNVTANQNGTANTGGAAGGTPNAAANNLNSSATPTQNNAATPAGIARNTSAPEVETPVTVIWASALPVRLAQVRLRARNGEPSGTDVAAAMRPRDHFTIAVVGLPVPEDGVDSGQLMKAAVLQVKPGQELHPTKADLRKFGETNVYVFQFAKSESISPAVTPTVEFRLNLMRTVIKKSFDLGSMVYQGKLEL